MMSVLTNTPDEGDEKQLIQDIIYVINENNKMIFGPDYHQMSFSWLPGILEKCSTILSSISNNQINGEHVNFDNLRMTAVELSTFIINSYIMHIGASISGNSQKEYESKVLSVTSKLVVSQFSDLDIHASSFESIPEKGIVISMISTTSIDILKLMLNSPGLDVNLRVVSRLIALSGMTIKDYYLYSLVRHTLTKFKSGIISKYHDTWKYNDELLSDSSAAFLLVKSNDSLVESIYDSNISIESKVEDILLVFTTYYSSIILKKPANAAEVH